MYKVILVDDEPWVSIGLEHLIEWEELGYTIIDKSLNGYDAIALI